MNLLPYGRQVVNDDDIEAVVRVLKSDFLTTGPEVPQFEREFAAYVNAPEAIACANGTAALHIASLALGFQPGDQVIVPTVSFVATANAARYCGAEVIFADVDPDSGLVTAKTILEAANRANPGRLKAIFVVHLAGHCADLPAISEIAEARGLAVIEDACHALGTTHSAGSNGMVRVGDCRLSSMAVFSFHPVKTITTGEGGMVTTRDPKLAHNLSLFRNHGLVRDPSLWVSDTLNSDAEKETANPWVYELQVLGYNYRLTDFQAALGRSQLNKMSRFSEIRRRLTTRYRKLMAELAPLVVLQPQDPRQDPVLHLMIALFDFKEIGLTRSAMMKELHNRGVGSQVHYIPIHRQPYYLDQSPTPNLPGADRYYERCLSLPLFPAMTENDVDKVVEAISAVVLGRKSG